MKKAFALTALGLSLSAGTAIAADATCYAKTAEEEPLGVVKSSLLKKRNANASTPTA